MVYLLETDLTKNKRLCIALTKIYGIGKHQSFYFCKQLGLSANLKVEELTMSQKIKLERLVENSSLNINLDLKKFNTLVNKKLLIIKSYRVL